jgi:predicted helicase
MRKPNALALITTRQTKPAEFEHVLVTRNISEVILLSPKTSTDAYIFPLYSHRTDAENLFELAEQDRVIDPVSNLNSLLVERFEESLIAKTSVKSTSESAQITPEKIFGYFYSIMNAPSYRVRYKEFLRRDFPKIPLTCNKDLFCNLANIGKELTALHLMESPKVKNLNSTFVSASDLISDLGPSVEKVTYSDNTVWLNKKQTVGFEGVPLEVWNFRIGGYQVCEKWLKDRQAKGGKNPRPGRILTKEDRDHYQGIIVALSETIRLMAEIDQVIDQHGGWPGAFQAKDSNE